MYSFKKESVSNFKGLVSHQNIPLQSMVGKETAPNPNITLLFREIF
jgi:hypothetical protein